MTVTIADVALTAAVSPGTVSNVLNHPDRVNAETRARVERAISLLGYRPNRHARMLAGGRDHGIGLVVHDTGNPFFARIADAVDDAATERGFSVVMASSRADDARQEAAMRLLLEHQLSGILLTPTVHSPDQVLEFAGTTPVVLLDYPGKADICSVRGNDHHGGRLAAQHMIDNGHHRLCYLGGPRRVRQHRDRANGVRSILRKTADPTALRVVHVPADTIEAGHQAAPEVKALLPQIDGVACGNDLLAIGLINGLGELGVDVPHDLAVIGYDDIDLASLISPQLTTIHQPIAEMGGAATRLLLEEILESDHRHQNLVVEPHLVVRSSASTVNPDGQRDSAARGARGQG